MRIASIDLAIRHTNTGVCLIDDQTVDFPPLTDEVVHALESYRRHWRDDDGGDDEAAQAATSLSGYLVAFEAQAIVVDGPQGFARAGRTSRRAEAILRTSGRTGPDFSLPIRGYSWPGIARLGVKLFNELARAGYSRLEGPQLNDASCAVEVFPDSCWHCFGLDAESLEALAHLDIGTALAWNGDPDEHQLDAAIGAVAVVAAEQGHAVFVGHPFFWDGDQPREGYIVIPNPGHAWTIHG